MERITRTHHPIFQSSHENPLQTPQAPASPYPSQRPATAPTQQLMADSAAAGILPVSYSPGMLWLRVAPSTWALLPYCLPDVMPAHPEGILNHHISIMLPAIHPLTRVRLDGAQPAYPKRPSQRSVRQCTLQRTPGTVALRHACCFDGNGGWAC